MTLDLNRLLRPKSVAVIGGGIAASVIRSLNRMQYEGSVWPVNPDKVEIEGYPCFPSLGALPSTPDSAFIAVNRFATIEAVSELSDMGAGGAIAYASGFRESGDEGRNLQDKLVDAAGSMPLIGPNCYGLINYLDGAALWLDHHGGSRCSSGVALIVQSSNIAITMTMQRRGLPIGYVMALGNQAVLGAAELIEAVSHDPRITAIGLYLESIADPQSFAGAALKCPKPIVAILAGRSELGAKQAQSHTASLVGADQVADAFLKRVGIARLGSVPALIETLKLLHVHGPMSGRDVFSLSCSGGEATMMADGARGRSLSFRPLESAEKAKIEESTHPLVKVDNPFDYHTFDWSRPDRLLRTFNAALACNFDLTLLILDLARGDEVSDTEWRIVLELWRKASIASGNRTALLALLPETLPESLAIDLITDGIAPLCTIDDAVDAIDAAIFLGKERNAPPTLSIQTRGGPDQSFDEAQGKIALNAYGVDIPKGIVVDDGYDGIQMTKAIGLPCVAKAIDATLKHKSEMGAVYLGLENSDAVEHAVNKLVGISKRVLVEEMVPFPIGELIIGFVRDRVFGIHMIIGMGGIFVELLDDKKILLLPSNPQDIREALLGLRGWPKFTGFRGQHKADINAVVNTIMNIQSFVLDHIHNVIELEINPLIVGRDRTVAADVILTNREE